MDSVTDEQLEKLNRYTRRALGRDEVFVFSVVLCDNEIDRDGERFTAASLERLGELYLGKTGVFDHDARSENQRARIFDTKMVQGDGKNSLGEAYCCLKAWAYMVRCEKNADLILEIDAGIKKEVSVGCAVERVECSVCGAEQRGQGCVHQKGEAYGGAVCHHVLLKPTDAYEWSFVAVPAQRNAGVTKRLGKVAPGAPPELAKLFETQEDITLSKAQLAGLARQYSVLEKLAQAGREYLEQQRREVVRLARLAQPELDGGVLDEVVQKMDGKQLQAFEKAFSGAVARQYPVSPQLVGAPSAEAHVTDAPFKI